MNCAICNQTLKQIPAGVSKATGKPYNAFWACADKTHKQPRTSTYPVQTQPVAQNNVNLTPVKPNWDAISFGKCKYGFLIEAYKMGKDPDVSEVDAEDWAMRSMRKLGKAEMRDYGQGETLTEIPF